MEENKKISTLPYPEADIRFAVETTYDIPAMTAMAHVLRRTMRRKHTRISHIAGWILVALALLLAIPLDGSPFVWNRTVVIDLAVAAVLVIVLFGEDPINGWVASRRTLPSIRTGITYFTDSCYSSVFPVGKSEWQYSAILQAAETKQYFVLVFSQSHAQVYAKAGFATGSPEAFAFFLEEKTGKPVLKV